MFFLKYKSVGFEKGRLLLILILTIIIYNNRLWTQDNHVINYTNKVSFFKIFKKEKSSKTKFSIEKLNRDNYGLWSYKMEMLLILEGFKSVVKDSPPDKPNLTYNTNDEKAQLTIALSITDSQIIHVLLCTVKEICSKIRSIHERENLS